jgi:hypothetical protein
MTKISRKLMGALISLILLVACAWAQQTNAGKSNQNTKNTSNSQAKDTDPNPNKGSDPPASLPSKLADAINFATDDKTDYVPCFFTQQQLLQLRPQVEVAKLGPVQAEELRSSVIAEALKPENASGFRPEGATSFAKEIGETSFEGRTRSEALAKVLEILAEYAQPALSGKGAETVRSDVNAEAQKSLSREELQRFTQTLSSADLGQTPEEAKTKVMSILDESAPNAAKSPSASKLATTAQESAQKAIASEASATKNNVADAARTNLSVNGRPDDIFCSMSILSYETIRKAFGETMADEYIGVQIVVRNLNREQEFLVQSAEFKVDEDINGRLSKYFSGVDKATAREYMLASRELGKRNLMVNVAEGVGSILSAAVPFTGVFVKQFSGVYSGGLVPSLSQVFPDHNTEQLKLLDDEGFSNSRTDRTVVPKSGTVEFVMFVSAKEFEEGWWVQPCAEKLAIQKLGNTSSVPAAQCIGTYNRAKPDPRCVAPDIGIDLELARNKCLDQLKNTSTSLVDKNNLDDKNNSDHVYITPIQKDFRHWSPQALSIFRELSLAVVAGTHVNEESNGKPSLDSVDCPKDDKGDVELDKSSNKIISCKLSGANLDKVSQLKLRNAKDPNDSTNGNVATSGQSKSATVGFQEADLCKLSAPTYKVFTVTSDGSESGGDQTLNFNDKACLSEDPAPDRISLPNPESVTLKGYRLDSIKQVCLGDQAFDVTATASQITIDFSKTQPKPGSLAIGLGDCASKIATGMTLTVSGTAASDKPELDSKTPFSPTSGPVGRKITIKGTNLTGASQVKFGGAIQATVTVVSDSELTAAVPKGAVTGSKPIEVTTPAGTVTSKTNFTVTSLKSSPPKAQ